MFLMNSAYTLDNSSAIAGSTGYKGISVSFTLETSSVPSDYTVILANSYNKLSFRWNPEKVTSTISTFNLSSAAYDPSLSGVGSWAGNQDTADLSSPYGEMRVFFEIRGNSARVVRTQYGISHEIRYEFPTVASNPLRNVSGWKVYVESRPVSGQASDSKMTKFVVTADASAAGSITIEYITLTATNIANKYVEIADRYATEVAVNLAQASTMKQGVDFEILGNRLIWAGYGMDIAALVEGLTMRVVYYSGTYGSPYYLKIGKRVVGLGGHGEV